MTTKEEFIERLRNRTKRFAVNVIRFCDTLKIGKASSVITYQLIKSATSTAANYRAACRARSNKEFYSKICIVVEEADETEYWLEVIKDAELTENTLELEELLNEIIEIIKIMSKAKSTSSNKNM